MIRLRWDEREYCAGVGMLDGTESGRSAAPAEGYSRCSTPELSRGRAFLLEILRRLASPRTSGGRMRARPRQHIKDSQPQHNRQADPHVNEREKRGGEIEQ